MADEVQIVANVVSGNSVVGGSSAGASVVADVDDNGSTISSNVTQGNVISSDNSDGSIVQTNVTEGETIQGEIAVGAKGAKGDKGDTGSQGSQGDPTTVNGKSGASITLNQDDIGDGSTYKQYSATEKTKLAGIAAGATANDTDANLKNRANHTGTQAISTVSGLQTALDDKLDDSQKGSANGLAELDSSGLVPNSQLPSYVDDVLEYANFAALPGTGTAGKIYVTLDDNKTYRWSGSIYVEISASLALGETSATAYRGDRGKIAYDHSQLTSGNPHNVTKSDVGLSNVDNTSDVNKPVSTAQQTEIDTKVSLATYAYDTDVTMTEFFGSAVDLGTGGFCRVDAKETEDFIWLRIYIKFGTSMSLGSLPLTILASDLPVTIPDYGAQVPMPGNFGALSIPPNENQMYAPALNNVGGFGNCILFFSEYGATFMDYLMGAGAPNAPAEGSDYFGTIMIPKMTMGS